MYETKEESTPELVSPIMSLPEEKSRELKNFLGFDFSTQQVKAIIIGEEQKVLHEASVQFDNELPEYRTYGGVNIRDSVVTAPSIMWAKALDMLMDKLRVAGAEFSTIAALSGSGQQHGSVYWKKGASAVLEKLSPDRFLHEQLAGAFSVSDSPVWMDSSTTQQCRKLEENVGGPQRLAEVTGSRAYERFTGNQIAKIYATRPDAYNNTERISLVSNFACSLFLGRYAPIDYSDASGMNLFDINTKQWSQLCLNACAPDLAEKLGSPVESSEKLGRVSSYFVERYEFDPECIVVAFTGDNPSSLAGMCLTKDDVAVSLGTSDTLYLWLDKPDPKLEGHILCNPLDKDAFMALLCFKNGSLTREKIRNDCADGSWEIFSQLLDNTPRGNFGNIGVYYHKREIIPDLEGVFCFTKANEQVSHFASKEVEVRALIEGQFLSKRIHAENIGLDVANITRVLATGGASQNQNILQVLSDVFDAPVYTMVIPNSACLGAAYRAKHGWSGKSYQECIRSPQFHLVCSPSQDSKSIYGAMAVRLRELESRIQLQVSKGAAV